MTTASRFDEMIARNRSQRVRDLGFGLLLAFVVAFALGSIRSAGGDAPRPTPVADHACAIAPSVC
ncbi:MAG: hypothetical protein IPL61_34340 [Myxococcales bacterium]|nr:hypothetical protein [Myxococcales bacterium]